MMMTDPFSMAIAKLDASADQSAIVKDFKDGKIKALVATDLVAKGFDVPRTFLVVNWNVPRYWSEKEQKWGGGEPSLYYHRAGRAGRFGKTGLCFTFVRGDYEEHCLKGIAGQYGIELHVLKESEIAKLPEEQASTKL